MIFRKEHGAANVATAVGADDALHGALPEQ